ncbi:MAG: hypothetical protein HZA28_08585 [Candidatus Omnitrophica bacterium]|nr:hypothetical protein [Candidatus Omnitrophota bacterium]
MVVMEGQVELQRVGLAQMVPAPVMGTAVPAAVGLVMLLPARVVVALAGLHMETAVYQH